MATLAARLKACPDTKRAKSAKPRDRDKKPRVKKRLATRESRLPYRLEVLLLAFQLLVPVGSRLHEGDEHRTRSRLAVVGALRMPLHPEDEMVWRSSLDS